MSKPDKCFEDACKILEDAPNLLDNIMFSMGDGLSIQDRNMRIVYQNQFMIDNFGRHVGEYCYRIYEKRDEMCEGCPVAEAFRTGNVTKALRVGITKDGTPFRFENIASALKNDQGEIVAGMELCRIVEDREKAFDDLRATMEQLQQTKEELVRDIAERKHIADELQKTRNRLAIVVNTIPDLIWLKDPDGVYLACNSEFERLYGASESEVLGKTDHDFVPRELADLFRQKDMEAINEGRITLHEEEVDYAADGRYLIMETRRVPVQDAGGGLLGVLGIGRDITKLKFLQSQLFQSQKLESIGRLAAGIAHEINNPAQYVINTISFIQDCVEGFLKLTEIAAQVTQQCENEKAGVALREVFEEYDFDFFIEELPKALSISLEGIGRIAKIVQSVKQFAHPGKNDREYFNLNEVVTSTVVMSCNEWKSVTDLETDLDETLPHIPGFRAELSQVLLNLIINSVHSIQEKLGEDPTEKGKISISTDRLNGMARIRVSDTGMGIPEDDRSKVFDPFFTTKEVGKGTGQGLAISFGIIHEKHGGTISFETEEGKGTMFTITLPLEAPSD